MLLNFNFAGLAFIKISNSSFGNCHTFIWNSKFLFLSFMHSLNWILSADDYPDIEIVAGIGGLSGDTSGTLRNLLGIPNHFYHSVYRDVIGKVKWIWNKSNLFVWSVFNQHFCDCLIF